MIRTRFQLFLVCAALTVSALAQADMAVIVSAKSSVASLSQEQAQKLFLGKQNAYPDGSAATPLDLPESSDRDTFYQQLTGKDSAQLKAYWSKIIFTGKGQPPKEVGSAKDMVQQVAKTPGALGYVPKAAVDGSVKVLLSLP